MNMTQTLNHTVPEALLLDIARRHFLIETLETRMSDGLDFHDGAVWAMRAALAEAYEAGLAAALALRDAQMKAEGMREAAEIVRALILVLSPEWPVGAEQQVEYEALGF